MPTSFPQKPLFNVLIHPSRRNQGIALGLSLAFATVYGVMALQQAFGGDYVVQDDARQHIFWMQRYLDPALFPDDIIADYFQSAAPLGYDSLYRNLARLGLEPDFVAKSLPFLLGLVAAGYAFFLSFELFPVPLSALITSAILNQGLWGSDEISSGTPRAFLYPLFLAFAYYLVRRSRWLCGIFLVLQAVLYPPILLISVGLIMLRLVQWQKGKPVLSRDQADYVLCGVGIVIILGLKFYMDSLSDFGAIVSFERAQTMPEFQAGGRNFFFAPGIFYWLHGYPWRSGILHRSTTIPITSVLGIFLPVLLRYTISPLKQRLRSDIKLLWQILIVSFGLFFLAHLLLFTLHLPSRYTSHTIRVVLAIASGIFFTLLFDDLAQRIHHWQRSRRPNPRQSGLSQTLLAGLRSLAGLMPFGLAAALLIITAFYYPLLLEKYPKTGYHNFDHAAPLYEFIAAQPKDSLTASISRQADNLPSFTGRSVLVSKEHALAYHNGYYNEIRQRAEALISAQYALNPAEVETFIEQYGVDLWLLDATAFEADYLADDSWLRQFQPMTETAIAALRQSASPVVQQSMAQCATFQTAQWTVLEANCVRDFATQLQ